jgi:glycosyltransferase involved in cell wall biosynthesis
VRAATASPDSTERAADAHAAGARPLLTAVVPVYNGGEMIVANVSSIQQALQQGLPGAEVEVIVVSDGSIDDTGERLLEAREGAGVRVIHYDRNLGKGYAVKAGALTSHGEWIALVDADLDLDPASIPEYLDVARREQLDFAIGSKRHPDSVVHYPRSRRIASRCYQLLNRVLFRLDIRDTQVGLKVFSRAVVEDVFPLLLVKRFAFDLELLAVARALGHGRVRELPIRLQYRFSGSQLRSRAVVRALLDTAAVFYRLRILRTYQRKRRLLRGAALARELQPPVALIGDPQWAATLDYEQLELEDERSDLVAVLAPRARPAGNWVSAAVPFFADPNVAAVVTPTFAPLRGRLRERLAVAVLESRLGGGSRRVSYFPGNVRIVSDYPADCVVIRRRDYAGATAAGVGSDELVAWLAGRGRQTVYTPEASVSAPPPPLVLPHLRATARYARARGAVARRTRGTSLSAATARSLLPLAAAGVGVVFLLIGGSVHTAGLVLVLGLGAALVASGLHAAIRFASLDVGLLEPPAVVATQVAYVYGFLLGLIRRA